jgi:Domain of unknown function (DUF1918)
VDQPAREGLILEVIRRSSTLAYRVRWSDGHESVFIPGAGSSRIEPQRRTSQQRYLAPAATGSRSGAASSGGTTDPVSGTGGGR